MVFKVHQEENPLYGLIGMEMSALSQQWLGGKGPELYLPPCDFGVTQTWLGSDRLKMAVQILLFKLCEMPQVNPGHKLSIQDKSLK